MTAPKPPITPADVIAALARAEALLKALRPLLKARRIDWHRVNQVLNMARDELNKPAHTILDWELERMRIARETILGPYE